MYSHPDGMFDVSGIDFESQKYANRQKAMLVNTFEKMKIEDEMEKIINQMPMENNKVKADTILEINDKHEKSDKSHKNICQ